MWRACLSFLALLIALAASVAAAEAQRARVIVVAAPEHGPSVTELFRAAVQARLPEVDVAFVDASAWSRQSERPPATTLVFKLDTSQSAEWHLRLEYQNRAWRRTIEGGVERDRAAIEAAALIAARTSVALLMTDESATAPGREPDELRAWAPAPVTSPANRSRARAQEPKAAPPANSTESDASSARSASNVEEGLVQLLAGYRGQSYADDHWWTQSTRVGGLGRLRTGPCLSVAGVLFLPVRVHSDFGSFEVSRRQLEFEAGWCFRWRAWRMSPRVGAAIEWTHRSATDPAPGVGGGPDDRSTAGAGVTAFEVGHGLGERWDIFAGLGAYFSFADHDYLAAGFAKPIFAPHRVRFTLDVGVAVRLF